MPITTAADQNCWAMPIRHFIDQRSFYPLKRRATPKPGTFRSLRRRRSRQGRTPELKPADPSSTKRLKVHRREYGKAQRDQPFGRCGSTKQQVRKKRWSTSGDPSKTPRSTRYPGEIRSIRFFECRGIDAVNHLFNLTYPGTLIVAVDVLRSDAHGGADKTTSAAIFAAFARDRHQNNGLEKGALGHTISSSRTSAD